MNNRNPIKVLAGQTLVYGLGTLVPRLLNYLLVPFYTRVFDEAAYGQITELYAYIAFLMVLLTYGMETAFFRFAQKNKANDIFNSSFTLVLGTTSIFVLTIILIGGRLSSLLGYDVMPEVVMLMLFIVAVDVLNALPFAMLRKQQRAARFTFIRITNVVVNIFLNFLFLVWLREPMQLLNHKWFDNSNGLVVWVFIANLVASLLSTLMLWPVMKSFRIKFDFNMWRQMLAYALPILVVGLAGMVNEVLDKILLKYLIDAQDQPLQQLGIYGANYKLGILMTLFVQMFRFAAEPFFFAKASDAKSPELFARVMHYFNLVALAIFLLVTLYIDFFSLLIGPAYREGLHIVPIILIANLFYGIYFNLSVWYKLTDRTRDGAKIALLGAMVTIVLNIWLVPIMGYVGAAWATLICYFSMTVVSYIWGQKVFMIPYKTNEFFRFLLLSLGLYAISWVVSLQSVALRIAFNTFLLGVYLYTAYRSFQHHERIARRSEIG